jgi:single-stranded DNA-binding protein
MVPRKTNSTVKKATVAKKAPAKKAAPVYQDVPKEQDKQTPNRQTTRPVNPMGAIGRSGNVGSIEELSMSQNGKPWIRFSIAYTPYNAQSKTQGEVVWYRCIAFGNLAENIAESFVVGMRVVVSGRPDVNKWTDENGETHEQKQILCEGAGPDLTFATASVTKVYRRTTSQGEFPVPEGYDEEPF